jgi:tetratricopeptide (TPR) repeat protein
MQGDQVTARHALEEAHELSIELDEPVLKAWSVFFRGLADTLAGAVEPAQEHLEASRELHRALGIRIGEARSLTVLALTYLVANEADHARSLYEEALTMYLDQGDTWGQGTCHAWLGMIAQSAEANPAPATSHFRQAAELLRPLRDATLLPVALVGQALVLGASDQADALRIASAASAIRTRVGGEFPPFV